MNKTIWIIHQYASTPETGMGGRHYYLAEELGRLGYNVYVIASGYTHLLREPLNIKTPFFFEKRKHFTFVWVKMPVYQEAHSKKRVLNWFLFPWKIQKLSRLISDKPDVILCSSPSPIAFLGAEKLAKKFKALLAFEVRDIWPLTLIKLGGYSSTHPFIRFMQWVEDRAYKNSDIVISNLRNAVEHMQTRGMCSEKFHWIPNGISLDEINEKAPLNSLALNQIPVGKFIIGYAGTIGVANSLITLIDAANQLKNYQDKFSFILVGSGKEKTTLQQYVSSLGLQNIHFLDPVPKKEIQSLLSHFHTCYIGWKNDNLYHYGIGANKIPEYLYSGKPILHGYSGNCDPISETLTGITIPAEDSQALAEAIIKIYNASDETKNNILKHARQAILEKYNYSILAKELAGILFKEKSHD